MVTQRIKLDWTFPSIPAGFRLTISDEEVQAIIDFHRATRENDSCEHEEAESRLARMRALEDMLRATE